MKSFPRAVLAIFVILIAPQANATIEGFDRVDLGLYRGSHPHSNADFKVLKDAGIKTILNLQSAPASYLFEAARAKENGINLIHEGVWAFTPYVSDEKIKKILNIMQDEALRPLYVHCMYGRDRTGLMVGLYRIHVQKWSSEDAYQEMLSHKFSPLYWGLYHFFKTHMQPGSINLTPSEKTLTPTLVEEPVEQVGLEEASAE